MVDSVYDFKKIYQKGYARMDFLMKAPRLIQAAKLIGKYIKPNKELRVLDLGCGDGRFTLKVGKIVGTTKLFGTDIADTAIKKALKLGIKIQKVDTDLNTLPFKNESFDLIICGGLIDIVLNPDKLILEAKRVLKPSGYLIVTIPNMCSWLNRIMILIGHLPYYYRFSRNFDLGKLFRPIIKDKSTGFIRLFTIPAFKQFMKIYGLHIIEMRGASEPALPSFISNLDKLLSMKPSFAFQIVSIISKESN